MSLETLGIIGLVFLVSIWLTRRLASSAARWRLLDHPNERSLHAAPIPRTGGLAILISLSLGLLIRVLLSFSTGGVDFVAAKTSLWIASAILMLIAVSLWNDWIELSPAFRFAIHLLAALGIAAGAGLTIRSISFPTIGDLQLGWLTIPLTTVCLIWMTNLYNFMDGMDGFAGGMTVLGFSFLGYVSWGSGQRATTFLSALTVVAVSGFLVYNWPPAKIFLGDVGSIFLGFTAGTLSLWGIHQKQFDLWLPVLIFSPFIVDATATICRRLLRGEKVWRAHRKHYYQRLVLLGWSHRKTVLAEYGLMILCGVSGLVYTRTGESLRLAILLTWVVIYCVLAAAVSIAERRHKLLAKAHIKLAQ
jgi:UDP-N-acetylmuramyl pentapeptide phosphotransferase/UDP-N-acetylglucosamine-1-phosphate transferase